MDGQDNMTEPEYDDITVQNFYQELAWGLKLQHIFQSNDGFRVLIFSPESEK